MARFPYDFLPHRIPLPFQGISRFFVSQPGAALEDELAPGWYASALQAENENKDENENQDEGEDEGERQSRVIDLSFLNRFSFWYQTRSEVRRR